jgi:hypothetical protein
MFAVRKLIEVTKSVVGHLPSIDHPRTMSAFGSIAAIYCMTPTGTKCADGRYRAFEKKAKPERLRTHPHGSSPAAAPSCCGSDKKILKRKPAFAGLEWRGAVDALDYFPLRGGPRLHPDDRVAGAALRTIEVGSLGCSHRMSKYFNSVTFLLRRLREKAPASLPGLSKWQSWESRSFSLPSVDDVSATAVQQSTAADLPSRRLSRPCARRRSMPMS